jgi:serine/threonine protein kinase
MMEYCNGGTLEENPIYTNYDSTKLIKLLDILVQIFLALDYVHNLGYVHEDLKSANILFSNNLVSLIHFYIV